MEEYLLDWKKKGFFTIVYLLLFFFLVHITGAVLKEHVGGIFATNYSGMWRGGIILILSGIATYLTDTYTLEKGKFVRDDYQLNEFFFLPMKFVGKVLIGFGILNLIGAILES